MNDSKLSTAKDIKAFLSGTCNVEITITKADRYSWLARLIKKVNYFFNHPALQRQGMLIRLESHHICHYHYLLCDYQYNSLSFHL